MSRPAVLPFDHNARMEPWPDFPDGEIIVGSNKHNGHSWFDDKATGLSACIWEQEANESRWIDYPVNEWMLVLEGEVVMIEESRTVSIKAGESFVVPKGTRCRWTQPGYVKKFFVIFDDPSGAVTALPRQTIKLDPRVKLEPSTPPSPDMLLSDVPKQNNHLYFEDATGQLTVGVWDTTGYRRKLIDFPRHELMHILEGAVTFEDAGGRQQQYKAGDTFFVPMGTPNAWTSEGYLRKIYVIFQPKA